MRSVGCRILGVEVTREKARVREGEREEWKRVREGERERETVIEWQRVRVREGERERGREG